jgi:transcription elongation factor
VNVFSVLNFDDFAFWARTQLQSPRHRAAAEPPAIEATLSVKSRADGKADGTSASSAETWAARGANASASSAASGAAAGSWTQEEAGDGYGGASGWRAAAEVAAELEDAEAWCAQLDGEKQWQQGREANAVGDAL